MHAAKRKAVPIQLAWFAASYSEEMEETNVATRVMLRDERNVPSHIPAKMYLLVEGAISSGLSSESSGLRTGS